MLIQYLREIMTNSFLQVGRASLTMTPQTVGTVFTSGLWLWIGLFLGAIALAVFVTQVAQVGINFTDDPFSFKFEKLNPLGGIKNIFSLNRLTQTGQSVVKLVVVTSFAYLAINEIQNSAVFSRPVSLNELGKVYVDIAWSLGWHIVMALGRAGRRRLRLAAVEIRPRPPDDAPGSEGRTALAWKLPRKSSRSAA